MSKCNYWWVTRPKRKLNPVPEILSVFAETTLEHQWDASRNLHIQFDLIYIFPLKIEVTFFLLI